MTELEKQLLDALEAMYLSFGDNFPDGESTAVDMAREAIKAAQQTYRCASCGSVNPNEHFESCLYA